MSPARVYPLTADALTEFLDLSGIRPIAVQMPFEDQQHTRVLVDESIDRDRLEGLLKAHFGRYFLVVHPGEPLHIARQLLQFIRRDVEFSVQDHSGVMVYVRDEDAPQRHARGKRFLNVETFRTFTGGQHLSIMRASAAHRTHVRSYFKMRARGFGTVPGENIDTLLAQQVNLITHDELLAARNAPEDDYSWGVPIEGPHLGSEDFYVPFLDREPAKLYDQVRAALEVVAPKFGLKLTDEQALTTGYVVKYFLEGPTGSVCLLFYNAPRRRKGLSHVVVENPALRIASNTLVPMMLHVLRARVS